MIYKEHQRVLSPKEVKMFAKRQLLAEILGISGNEFHSIRLENGAFDLYDSEGILRAEAVSWRKLSLTPGEAKKLPIRIIFDACHPALMQRAVMKFLLYGECGLNLYPAFFSCLGRIAEAWKAEIYDSEGLFISKDISDYQLSLSREEALKSPMRIAKRDGVGYKANQAYYCSPFDEDALNVYDLEGKLISTNTFEDDFYPPLNQ